MRIDPPTAQVFGFVEPARERRNARRLAGTPGRDVARCSPRRRSSIGVARLVLCAFGITLLSPFRALVAQDTPASREGVIRAPAPPQAAVEHYERGRREYLAGRYREALVELKAALALDPNSPNLVYNVARVNEDLAELDEAIKYYQRYRKLLPPDATEEREKTAMTIRRLQGAKDAQARNPPNVQPVPPVTQQPSAGRADTAFWLIAATGVALAAGGGVTGFLALRREKEVADFVLGPDGSFERRSALRKDADRLALASDIMSVSAGVVVVTAAVLFFARTSEPEPVSASVSLSPRAGSLELRARF